MPVKKNESPFDKEAETNSKSSKAAKSGEANNQRSVIISAILVLVLLIALGSGIYYYLQYQNAQQLLKNPTLGAQMETQNLVTKVGSLIDLPQGEQPTIATVSDITKLKGQTFFANAQNGDKVLIYTKAKKAILYRPLTNKIIEVGPINIGSTGQNTASSSASTPTPSQLKITLYNGTKTPGFATTTEKQLVQQMPNVIVVSKGNAAKQDYTKSLVIDLSGKQSSQASQIASYLKGQVGKLPIDETRPANADILVILGGK